jgi:multiple sugar transport system permease protein
MNTGLLFTIGTIFTWVGFVFAFRVLASVVKILVRVPDSDPAKTQKQISSTAIAGAVLLLFGFVITKPLQPASFKLPLFWFSMPWMAWIGFGLLIFTIMKVVQALTGITKEESKEKLISAGFAFAGVPLMVYLYLRDKENKIDILSGGIEFRLGTFVAVLLLMIGAIGFMSSATRSATQRGLGKTVAAQLALLAGSVVFGIPFVFLLITSFKEDIDMASPNGIIWVPRVTNTYSYISDKPERQHFTTNYDGQTVEALVIGESTGKVKMDIFKPIAIRGVTFETTREKLTPKGVDAKIYTASQNGQEITGFEADSLADGQRVIRVLKPTNLAGQEFTFTPDKTTPVRHIGLRTQNYSEALDYLPPETLKGLVYLKNTLILVVMGVIGTILSSSIVAYAFSRMKFPGKDQLFTILLATMMLPGAVTLLPQFLIFRSLGWIDTLYPLWVPAFFGSAFNIFLLRTFFSQIPMELEDAAKIDGCSYLKTFWDIMIPQIKPALAVIAIWAFMGAWNNFMGPLIYVNSPENMPLSYALQLFKGDRASEPGLLNAFSALTVIPVVALFFFTQKYFVEGVTLSGLGGR